MSPITHLLMGWTVANAAPALNRRDRALVTLAGVIPDLDGLGVVAEWWTRGAAQPLTWWSDYHHLLGHNLGFCLLTAGLAAGIASRRAATFLLAILNFHLHLLGDLAGSRGPEGEVWPIPYLLPFSADWQLAWPGQWALNAWPNFLITALLLGWTLRLAHRRGFSPLEMISTRADAIFVDALRRRFPR
jgi:inner membrane protein